MLAVRGGVAEPLMNSVADPDYVASPCRQTCLLGADGICIGCGRSLGEVEQWPEATAERKRAIRVAAAARLQRMAQSRHGADP
jgi:uncharacterized protein